MHARTTHLAYAHITHAPRTPHTAVFRTRDAQSAHIVSSQGGLPRAGAVGEEVDSMATYDEPPEFPPTAAEVAAGLDEDDLRNATALAQDTEPTTSPATVFVTRRRTHAHTWLNAHDPSPQ